MSYIKGVPDSVTLVGIVAAPSGWRLLELSTDDWYIKSSIVAFAHVKNKRGHDMLCPIVGDREICGNWHVHGLSDWFDPPASDYFLGIVGPDESIPDDDELKARIEIVLEVNAERELNTEEITA
jgi:hypothetical protein